MDLEIWNISNWDYIIFITQGIDCADEPKKLKEIKKYSNLNTLSKVFIAIGVTSFIFSLLIASTYFFKIKNSLSNLDKNYVKLLEILRRDIIESCVWVEKKRTYP